MSELKINFLMRSFPYLYSELYFYKYICVYTHKHLYVYIKSVSIEKNLAIDTIMLKILQGRGKDKPLTYYSRTLFYCMLLVLLNLIS